MGDIAYSTVPNLIAQCQVEGLKKNLNLDDSQVFTSIIPALDPLWQGNLMIQVVPGAERNEGSGDGAQSGGAMLRSQTFKHVVFYRCKLDSHGTSSQILTENANGMLDLFMRMYYTFNMSYLGVGPNNVPLLYQRMTWNGNSETTWVDAENGVVQRSMLWDCCYGMTLPSIVTLSINNLP